MYSLAWFDTFALSMSPEARERELAAIRRLGPAAEFPRVLDVGCGVGRTAAGLVQAGYRVTGIDIDERLVAAARARVPGAEFLVLDQRSVADLGRRFDLALILWHSLGGATVEDDVATLHGLAQALRPGGMLLLDLFHPDWLRANERRGHRDERGATIDRSVQGGRCVHRIVYDKGTEDRIEFNVYDPSEMTQRLGKAGFEVGAAMAWWDPAMPAGPRHARYQLVCRTPR